jgi:N-acetylmuramoyl-L-alanine amidase
MFRLFSLFFICFTLTSCGQDKSAKASQAPVAQVKRFEKSTPNVIKENAPLVVIDAGHGGFDLGTHSKTYEEKEICLKTAMYLRKYLEKAGFKVILTRSRDEYLPLKKRAEIANQSKCQILISVHCNSAKNTTAKGIEIFYTKKTEPWRAKKSKELAQAVLSNLIAKTGAESRGIKEANFCVIRETKMPSILIETGFLTNEEERKKLSNEFYLEAVAKSITDGVQQYFASS